MCQKSKCSGTCLHGCKIATSKWQNTDTNVVSVTYLNVIVLCSTQINYMYL